jgi:hypothetical protein
VKRIRFPTAEAVALVAPPLASRNVGLPKGSYAYRSATPPLEPATATTLPRASSMPQSLPPLRSWRRTSSTPIPKT